MIRQLQTLATAYASKGTVAALLPRSNQQLHLVSAKLTNNSGGAIDMGIFRLFKQSDLYNIITTVGAGPTITDVTASINSGTATTLVTTTNNDGFYVGANEMFGFVGLTVSQADGGGSTYTVKYWNGAWTTLTNFATFSLGSTGTQLLVFAPPVDWAKGGTGLSASQFNIQVLATTAGATAVKVTAAWVAQMLDYAQAVADKASFTWGVVPIGLELHWNSGEGLLPYFGTANAKNMVVAQYLAKES